MIINLAQLVSPSVALPTELVFTRLFALLPKLIYLSPVVVAVKKLPIFSKDIFGDFLRLFKVFVMVENELSQLPMLVSNSLLR